MLLDAECPSQVPAPDWRGRSRRFFNAENTDWPVRRRRRRWSHGLRDDHVHLQLEGARRPADGQATGQKVVAVAVSKNTAVRRSAEDALVSVLTAGGAQGVPSYSIISDDAVNDEAKAKAAIETSGAVAVVVMRPVAKEQEISSTPSTINGAHVRRILGRLLRLRLGRRLRRHPIRTDTIVIVETLVYSLKQNKLVWAGESKTTNPSKNRCVREGSGCGRRQGNEETRVVLTFRRIDDEVLDEELHHPLLVDS